MQAAVTINVGLAQARPNYQRSYVLYDMSSAMWCNYNTIQSCAFSIICHMF